MVPPTSSRYRPTPPGPIEGVIGLSTDGLSTEEADAPVVLVVEDEQELAELYATGLGETYSVRTAFDGEQALEQLDETVDVVLLDRRMPGLSGDEVLDRIRERRLDCRVVMVSAVEPDFDVLEMGFDDYVNKPVSADELRETVDRMLELATHDATLQEYHSLVSKKIALEAKKSLRELSESEEYAELQDEIADRREQLDADHAELQEAMASAAVFQNLDTSGTPPPDPIIPADTADTAEPPSGADTSPDPDAETVEKSNSDAETDGEPDSGAIQESSVDSDPSPREQPASDDALLEAVPAPILVEDADRTVIDCNPALADLFGYPKEEIAGKSSATLYDDAEAFESMGERFEALADDETVRETVDYRSSDGAVFAGETNVGTRRDAAGEVVAYVSAIREVSDLTSHDRPPETTAEELAVLNRLLRHDIGNDMSIVTGWLELLREEVTADQRELLDRAIAATDHTIELTHAVGDLVRAIDEPEALDLETVSLTDVVTREVQKVRSTYDDATIEADDLPPVDVRANDLLSSVVRNLLNNAIQHNDADDQRVELSIEVGFHTATLRIADDGPGIAQTQRETLFEQGQKGAESAGLGIGLSLVKRLVDVYDGTIRFEDNEPRGTVVAVELAKAE